MEYNFTEVFFENKTNNDWSESEKRLERFISLLDQGISFTSLAEKYGFRKEYADSSLNGIIEDNLDLEVKKIITEMKEGDIYKKIKVYDGYKIIKLNKKRIVGYEMVKYSFIKISSFEIENLDFAKFSSISCSDNEYDINNEISAIKLKTLLQMKW